MIPEQPQRPVTMSRGGAGAFGFVLLLAGSLSGFFAAMPLMVWFGWIYRKPGFALVVMLGLFGPMAAVLLSAAWSLGAYAITGVQRPMLSRAPVAIFSVALVLLILGVVVVSIGKGDWMSALSMIGEGGFLVLVLALYLRSTKKG